jgi:hypothetical protein
VRREVALAVAAGTGLLSVRVEAATTQISGLLDLHAGYGSNPFFSLTSLGGAPSVGTDSTARLVRTTSTSRTEISGELDVDHYLKHYDTVQNYSARLRHNQQISRTFAMAADVSYLNSIDQSPAYGTRPSDLTAATDLLTVGQRTQRVAGGLDATWEPNEHNLFQAGLNASHATFGGTTANAYNQYGVSAGYLRTLNAHTKIGIQGGAAIIDQTGQPRAKSFTIGLQLVHDFGPRWHFEGGVSALAQTSLGKLVKTPGFNASLCGKYTKVTICFLGSRQSAPSGLGGLRTDTQGGPRIQYKPTPHDMIEATALSDISAASPVVSAVTGESIAIPSQKYWDGALTYRHDISARLTVGGTARDQQRNYGTLFSTTSNKVNAYQVTVNVGYKFGRLG